MSEVRLSQQFPGYSPEWGMEQEPDQISEDELDRVLLWAVKVGASDVDLMTQHPVMVQCEGHRLRLTKRNLSTSDMERIAAIFYRGSNAVSFLNTGGEIDTNYQIKDLEEDAVYQFRINVTACRAVNGGNGIQATIRTIKGMPPTFADLKVEQEIIDAFCPETGLVIVCGKTGSGKSTLIAASIREKLESPVGNYKILTYESPPEYVFDEIDCGTNMIVQHEIPKNLKSFPAAVRNSLRRAATDVNVGECRDYESFSAAVEASETGQRVYTTLHAKSVGEAITRMLNFFPEGERVSKLFEVMDTLRMIVAQKLVVGVNSKRVGLREYLVFDQNVRDNLRHAASLKDMLIRIDRFVEERGQSMLKAAYKEFNAGRIDGRVIEALEDGKRNILDDFDTNF